MGVAGLHGALAGYAVPMRWRKIQQLTDNEPQSLIIDGPALAYHVFYVLLSQHKDAGHPLRAIPSYQRIGEGVSEYLDTLKQYGLCPKHIFFDGHLPAEKTSVRLGRLQRYLDQMRASRLLHPALEDAGERRMEPPLKRTSAPSKVSASFLPPKMKAFPAPPFLVPAVVEALRASEAYARFVEVVPCEADLKCSDPLVCTESDILLTSDSDLILQAPRGRIVFFNSIEEKNAATDKSVLTADAYSSIDIATKVDLPLPRLVLLGYYLQHRQSDGLGAASKLARVAESDVEDSAEFKSFAAPYRPFADPVKSWEELFNEDELPRRGKVLDTLKFLDARIAEYLVKSKMEPSQIPVYLPALLDDPSRTSAWQSGWAVRQIAYSAWSQHLRNLHGVLEYDRRGTRLAAIPVDCLPKEELDETADKLLDLLGEVKDRFPTPTTAGSWCSICLVVMLRIQKESGKVVDKREVLQMLEQDYRTLTWAGLHFHSQLEGFMYSLRLLAILLGLIDDLSPSPSRKKGEAASPLQRLRDALSTFPGIREIFESPGRCMTMPNKRLIKVLLRDIYPTMDSKEETRIKTKKRKKQAESKPSVPNKKPSSSNPFDVLADS